MIRIVMLMILLVISSALAQQQQPSPIERQLKFQFGELLFTNSVLVTQVEGLNQENAKLKAQIEELKKKTETTGPVKP